MSDSERIGRILLDFLEQGKTPESLVDAQESYAILEENKKAGTIPMHRLERFLELLKTIIKDFLGREERFSLNGLKQHTEALERDETPKRNRDRGMSI